MGLLLAWVFLSDCGCALGGCRKVVAGRARRRRSRIDGFCLLGLLRRRWRRRRWLHRLRLIAWWRDFLQESAHRRAAPRKVHRRPNPWPPSRRDRDLAAL